MKLWEEGLEKHEQIVYIPISSGLSGSCAAALAMAQEEPFQGRVFVVDNGSSLAIAAKAHAMLDHYEGATP